MCNGFVTIAPIYSYKNWGIGAIAVSIKVMTIIAKEISMRNTHLRRFFALLMVLIMTCASASAATVKAGETISSTSKWINSDIEGAVNENTQVSIKDDFHTAANLEWLLDEDRELNGFDASDELLHDRKIEIVLGKADIDPANADAVGLSREWLAHDLKLVQNFSSLSGEWAYRNAYGIEPARPFIEAIESIQTMDDMTAYMLNENGMNITCLSLVSIDVTPDPENESVYIAALLPNQALSLQSRDQYMYMNSEGITRHFGVEKAVRYLLGRFGYSEEEANEIVKKCYRFETRLIDQRMTAYFEATKSYPGSYRRMSKEEVAALVGQYPLAQQLAQFGSKEQNEYLVYETSYFKGLNKLYQNKYLDEMKAMCLVQTAVELLPLLDEEAYDMAEKIHKAITAVPRTADEDEPIEQPDQELADKADAAEFVFKNYLGYYLPGPMDQIYVAAYCTPALKAEVRGLIDDILEYYGEMIDKATWLSESARTATKEKLDNMVIRCVYPDQFVDYTGLDFKGCRNNEGGTLPQAVAAINRFHLQRSLDKAGKNVNRGYWDMSEEYKTTTWCNAFHMPSDNSINIPAGIVTEAMFGADMSIEEKLAGLGTIIGHEITHAFDTTGYKFDKNGKMNPWWSKEDVEAFDLRASSLINYYTALRPYPGALLYDGIGVSGEAIADMGGMKCMLAIAKTIPDFDYDKFFRTYAKLWRTCWDFEMEKIRAKDVHPLNFLRTNVTVMQFDEFNQTYDIQPGDGMYMDPAQRISVW